MNSCTIRSLSVLASIGLVGIAFARVEPGAFLNKHVQTTSQLVQQVQSDPEVAGRFMQHYGMTQQEIVAYFRSLRTTKLAESGQYTVYSSHDEGIRSKVLSLKKGTLVWVDSNGVPVLKLACANPMGTGPRAITENPDAVIEAVKVPRRILRDAVTPGDSEVMETTVMSTEPGFTMPAEEPVVDAAPPILSPPEPLPQMGGGGGSDWLPALLLPFLIRPPGGGGDASIPEPATMVILAVGTLPIMRSVLRRKSRSPRA